jgi:formylmethanofuran dehydrogenase subunit E
MAVGFFDLFFDSDYKQRRDINSLATTETVLAADMSGLSRQVAQLGARLDDLSLTIAVLVKILQEQTLADPKVLHYRVEAEKEAIAEAARDAAKQMAASAVTASHPHKAPAPVFQVRCDKCGNQVPSTRTTITADGTLCDRCAP